MFIIHGWGQFSIVNNGPTEYIRVGYYSFWQRPTIINSLRLRVVHAANDAILAINSNVILAIIRSQSHPVSRITVTG